MRQLLLRTGGFVTLCVLGGLLGNWYASAQTKDAQCTQTTCKNTVRTSSPDCPGAGLCDFGTSSGNVVYCISLAGPTCDPEDPPGKNSCKGKCVAAPQVDCTVTWDTCFNPS